jgi:hypothetical protein
MMVKLVRCVEVPGRKPHSRLTIGEVYELVHPTSMETFEQRRRGGFITSVKLNPPKRGTSSVFASRLLPICQQLDENTIII